jgi:hypothetical protein
MSGFEQTINPQIAGLQNIGLFSGYPYLFTYEENKLAL